MKPPERSYQEARGLLNSYFVQKPKINKACKRPIVKGPAFSGNGHKSLVKFSANFTSCLITLEGMNCLDRMDNTDVMTKIMTRGESNNARFLPGYHRQRCW